MQVLDNKTVALVATDGFEDSELTQPMQAAISAGAQVVVISENENVITGRNGTEINVDKNVDAVESGDYDGLILPGGVTNPDKMRTNKDAVKFIKSFFSDHKPVAAICHAPWLLIEADVVNERTVTSWPSLKTDLKNAGATWVDQEVVVDQGLVTSRNPDDLPAFCSKMVEEFAEGKHSGQVA